MNLAILAYEMRAAGIRSLALELSESPSSPVTATIERDTLAPGDAPEPEPTKDPTLCQEPGCVDKAEGLFGGKAGGTFCRTHALQKAGVRA